MGEFYCNLSTHNVAIINSYGRVLLQLVNPQYGNINGNNASVDDSAWVVELFSAYF